MSLNVWPWPTLGVETRMQADLAEWFGLSPAECRILEALYLRGEWLPHKRLAEIGRCSYNHVKNCMAELRQALNDGSLESSSHYGSRLSEGGKAECGEALRLMAEYVVERMEFVDKAARKGWTNQRIGKVWRYALGRLVRQRGQMSERAWEVA